MRCLAFDLMLFLSTPSARRATRSPIRAMARLKYFYPRPPRGGRRSHRVGRCFGIRFLSTPSARRATRRPDGVLNLHQISIHALREEGDCLSSSSKRFFMISIHALREEGDTAARSFSIESIYFYPRPPRGGRPHCRSHFDDLHHFYPRPPRGGRLGTPAFVQKGNKFLSTPSARRATTSAALTQP